MAMYSKEELDKWYDIFYRDMKNGVKVVKISDSFYTCPFCYPYGERNYHQLDDLQRHASRIRRDSQYVREKAAHIALERYMRKYLCPLERPGPPPTSHLYSLPKEEFTKKRKCTSLQSIEDFSSSSSNRVKTKRDYLSAGVKEREEPVPQFGLSHCAPQYLDSLDAGNGDQMFVHPWKGILANIKRTKDENTGKYAGESGDKIRDLLVNKGVNPRKVTTLWESKIGFTGFAFVDFGEELEGFRDAIIFDKHFQVNRHGKKDYERRRSDRGDKLYGWVANQDDYYSGYFISEHLKKKGELRSLSSKEAEYQRTALMQTKYKEPSSALEKAMREKDEMINTHNEKMSIMQQTVRDYPASTYEEHEKPSQHLEARKIEERCSERRKLQCQKQNDVATATGEKKLLERKDEEEEEKTNKDQISLRQKDGRECYNRSITSNKEASKPEQEDEEQEDMTIRPFKRYKRRSGERRRENTVCNNASTSFTGCMSKEPEEAPPKLVLPAAPIQDEKDSKDSAVIILNDEPITDPKPVSHQEIKEQHQEEKFTFPQDKANVMAIPETPPRRVLKVYARRKAIKLKPQIIDDSAVSHQEIKEQHQEEKFTFPQVKDDDDPQSVGGKRKRKNRKGSQKRQRFNIPRIMEEGKKPRDPVTIRVRTRSNKSKKKKDKDSEDEFIAKPVTPKRQSSRKRTTKNKKPKKRVSLALTIKQETNPSCLELRRSDFSCLMSTSLSCPMPIWKRQSRRSKRKKNMTRWAKLALSFERLKDTLPLIISHQEDNGLLSQPDVSLQSEDPKLRAKRTKDIAKHLIQQMNYQKDHSLLSLADVPLHIEDTLMRAPSNEPLERPIRKAKDISILVKAMRRLKINNRAITTLSKPRKKIVGKVDLDPETIKEWDLIMGNDPPRKPDADKEREAKWKEVRKIFQSQIERFINRMHILQGDRKFKQWKGSVVDSVVGVFLTQNVSDYLSSNAFMNVAAKFPVDVKEGLEGLTYYVEEPPKVNDSVVDDQIGNNDAKDSEFISLSERSILEVEEQEKPPQRKNETVDWNSIRRLHTKKGARNKMHMDIVNWDAVRLSGGEQVLENTIIQRGQFRILARRILKFLNDEANQYGTVDLEWLRDLQSNLVKRYLLEIEGIGLKSVECVRLLGLKHSAFPVDTNVGRIAVRLGWVPLEPLPNGVQFHQLTQYPSMDSIQKYLWPRLCELPQETLYELHYQMITFGKVFCTKDVPNCNACPMKSDCKYFASAYVSSKALLQGSEEKTHESDTSTPIYSQDIDPEMTPSINLVEECGSSGYSDQTVVCCEPMVEFPSSPSSVIPELTDIEDMTGPCQSYSLIPEIEIDLAALKKNVEDAIVRGGKMQNSFEDGISKALVALTPENACIPINPHGKIKFYDRLRTEHVVYVLPDDHQLLHDFERRDQDDPSPYLLAIWQPGETPYSYGTPKKRCNSDGSELCKMKTCSYCWTIREQRSNTFRGTILIPCRTAMRGGFPLNGTYFQTNEVFADHKTSLKPIDVPRKLCEGLRKSALYCGSSVTSIFKFLETRRIQLCFWTGFVCMRGFDREKRTPKKLVRRLHTPLDQRGAKFMKEEDV